MLKELIFLQTFGYTGNIGNLLDQLAQTGFFSYILPFLLIFALVFGLLSRTKIFEGSSINGIISLVVALMALQFNFVSIFFAEIFPRLGIGLAVILVLLIVVGFFSVDKGWMTYVYFILGAIIFVVILINSAGALGWANTSWWYANWRTLLVVLGLIIAVAIIIGGSNPSSTKEAESPLMKILKGIK
ncbi:MAG TPA: hypothetical protein VJH65_01455 [Candidatus Nanoarchaeia archaeon]|nr:hypothetical protein [Candidatus Nanoarchaeia archaeon]